MAYSNNSIGLYSNSITKVWNSDEPNLDVIKLLCLEGNYSIDSAKTLFFIERPDNINNLISRYTKSKTPHFFIYAKDKLESNVEPINITTIMGKIEALIPTDRLKFDKHGLGTFDYTMLMNNKSQMIIDEIVDKFTPLNLAIGHNSRRSKQDDESNHMDFMYQNLRNQMFDTDYSQEVVVDVIIAYMFGKKTKYKNTLWSSFGDIIYDNLINNLSKSKLKDTVSCDICGVRVQIESKKTKYCPKCQKDIQLEHQKKAMKRLRNVKCENDGVTVENTQLS
jgi:predicted RNA-binding Zn-ribbon protein involved in translation (DUF1610 family)